MKSGMQIDEDSPEDYSGQGESCSGAGLVALRPMLQGQDITLSRDSESNLARRAEILATLWSLLKH